ncbi:MAG TPA: tRNA pseudouridine(13) synthase TruD [Phycisphaerales bacterium]|nr:tRNA pseudouridine(13) synthase TruD [Phycisphaerales bacterium]
MLTPAGATATTAATLAPWPFPFGSHYATPDLPGIGGVIKQREEDFLVDEQPRYQPVGEGEHCYLLIEKRGLSTQEVVALLARHFRVPRRAIGFAGMKDKRAITRQVFSVHTPGSTIDDFPMLQNDRAAVLWADMHTNKLRLGHLRGNRFSVKVRGVRMTQVLGARIVLERLRTTGVPNFAGEQRFGVRLNNHTLGRFMLREDYSALLDELLAPDPRFPHLNREARAHYAAGDYRAAIMAYPRGCRYECAALNALLKGPNPQKAFEAVDAAQRRFWCSAFQSAVFNRVLMERLEGRPAPLDALVEGDLAWKHDNGAVFAVDAPTLGDPRTTERLRAGEISPSGPVWGAEMTRAAGAPGDTERRLLDEGSVTPEALELFARRMGPAMSGARRPLRVPLIDPEVEGGIDEHGEYVRCAFELPPGAFATVVMREVMKNDAPPTGDGQDAHAEEGEAE